MSRYVSFVTTIEVPCPVCHDGEVSVDVTMEPPDPACGCETNARAEGTLACTSGCEFTDDQITELYSRAESRALQEHDA